jgi:hypothetical protein
MPMLEIIALDIGLCGCVFVVAVLFSLIVFGHGTFPYRHPVQWARSIGTIRRWVQNPFQMWSIAMLTQTSIVQLLVGITNPNPMAYMDIGSQAALSWCNLIGSSICTYGLYLREEKLSQLIEMAGYLSLAGSVAVYIWLVYWTQPLPNSSFGLNLSEAFVFASVHRVIQIVRGWTR